MLNRVFDLKNSLDIRFDLIDRSAAHRSVFERYCLIMKAARGCVDGSCMRLHKSCEFVVRNRKIAVRLEILVYRSVVSH